MEQAGKALVVALLRGYKHVVSPMLPPACRYIPTCSEYAVEAVERRGVFHGCMLAAWRLLRCHPFAKGGLDPVPLGRDAGHHQLTEICSQATKL